MAGRRLAVAGHWRLPGVAVILALVGAAMLLGSGRAAEGSLVRGVGHNVAVSDREPAELIEDFNSPDLAVDPNDPARLVVTSRFESPDRGCRVHHSADGGATWRRSDLPALPEGRCWAPKVTIDTAGRVFVSANANASTGGSHGVFVWVSDDAGATFAEPVAVFEGDGFLPGVAADVGSDSPYAGRVHVVWYDINPDMEQRYRAYLSYTDDGGRTWSEPSFLSRPDDWQYIPDVTVGADGTVYVIFKDLSACPGFFPEAIGGTGTPTTCPIGVIRSSDGGDTFDASSEAAVGLHDDMTVAEAPAITVAPNGDVLVAYASLPHSPAPGCPSDDVNVFVVRSTDRGETWSRPVRVHDDPCTIGADQYDPWIDVAPNGRVDVVFYDTRNDPDGVLMDLYHTASDDGGVSFQANRRVTDRSFDARVMFTPKSAGLQSKDFARSNGLLSDDSSAIAAWGDARNTLPNSPDGDPHTSASDIFTAKIAMTGDVTRPVSRIGAAHRYATAAAISRATFSFAQTVTIASGEVFADALAGGPLARQARGPVLLTPQAGLAAETVAEIRRLDPSRAYVLGGTSAIAAEVDQQLEALGVEEVVRIAGADRYETAAETAERYGPPPSATALLASGENFPDGVAAAAYGAFRRMPVLLTTKETVPAATMRALEDNGIDRVVIVGGHAAVSEEVQTQLDNAGYQTERVAGPDRYATAVALAERGIDADAAPLRIPVNTVYAATGRDFPDSLAAAAAVAYRGGVLLLADGEPGSASFLDDHRRDIDRAVLLGGCAAATLDVPSGYEADGCR